MPIPTENVPETPFQRNGLKKLSSKQLEREIRASAKGWHMLTRKAQAFERDRLLPQTAKIFSEPNFHNQIQSFVLAFWRRLTHFKCGGFSSGTAGSILFGARTRLRAPLSAVRIDACRNAICIPATRLSERHHSRGLLSGRNAPRYYRLCCRATLWLEFNVKGTPGLLVLEAEFLVHVTSPKGWTAALLEFSPLHQEPSGVIPTVTPLCAEVFRTNSLSADRSGFSSSATTFALMVATMICPISVRTSV